MDKTYEIVDKDTGWTLEVKAENRQEAAEVALLKLGYTVEPILSVAYPKKKEKTT